MAGDDRPPNPEIDCTGPDVLCGELKKPFSLPGVLGALELPRLDLFARELGLLRFPLLVICLVESTPRFTCSPPLKRYCDCSVPLSASEVEVPAGLPMPLPLPLPLPLAITLALGCPRDPIEPVSRLPTGEDSGDAPREDSFFCSSLSFSFFFSLSLRAI